MHSLLFYIRWYCRGFDRSRGAMGDVDDWTIGTLIVWRTNHDEAHYTSDGYENANINNPLRDQPISEKTLICFVRFSLSRTRRRIFFGTTLILIFRSFLSRTRRRVFFGTTLILIFRSFLVVAGGTTTVRQLYRTTVRQLYRTTVRLMIQLSLPERFLSTRYLSSNTSRW